jgi:cysteine synthase A
MSDHLLGLIGNTPLRHIDDVWVKLECSNPGGSVKDRVAKFILARARERGDLQPGDTIVEATSGNTGIAMTMVARQLGHPVIIFMPEHMSEERKALIRVLGADLRLTPRQGGFELPIEERDRYRDRAGHYVPDQFSNPDNTRCHSETTGVELVEQLTCQDALPVDAFVAGVGTGGTLMGVGQTLRDRYPDVAIIAVEPTEAAVMSGGAAGDHGIQGIGDGFIPALVDMAFIDSVAAISTDDAVAEAERIGTEHGFCVGVSAGANMLAARALARQGRRVATIWPDCSDRYTSMGLAPPSAAAMTCPLKSRCSDRVRKLLADLEPVARPAAP